MENSSSNRYELLYVDDDIKSLEVNPIVEKKEFSAKSVSKRSVTKKPIPQSEKENKSNTLNKIEQKPSVSQPKKESRANESDVKIADNSPRKTTGRNRNFRDQRDFRSKEDVGNSNVKEYNNEIRKTNTRFIPRNREGFRNGKREFDRQSGSDKTGIKAVDKRDGAGAHNWGSFKQEIQDINIAIDNDGTLTDKDDMTNEQTTELTATNEEDATKEMTLDEYKALTQNREKPTYNIRKPGEGEDTNQWKKMIKLNKKENIDSEEELEYDPSLYPQRVGRLQRIVDIQFNFKDSRRGGNNSGRVRGRGPRLTSANKADRGQSYNKTQNRLGWNDNDVSVTHNILKMDDEQQFPTLN